MELDFFSSYYSVKLSTIISSLLIKYPIRDLICDVNNIVSCSAMLRYYIGQVRHMMLSAPSAIISP